MTIKEFNLASSEKQDKILSNFPIKAGFNPFDYEGFSVETEVKDSSTDVVVVEVSGAGYLNVAIVSNTSDSNDRRCGCSLEIDGEIIYQKEYASAFQGTTSGVCLESDVVGGSIRASGSRMNKEIETIVINSIPIYFKESLVFKIRGENSNITGRVSGGVLIE